MKKLAIVGIILAIVVFIICFLNLNNVGDIVKKTIPDKKAETIEKVECIITSDMTTENIPVLVTFYGTKDIKQVKYHDGFVVYCNDKTKISRDMQIKAFTTYKIDVEYEDGQKVEKTYKIDNVDKEFNYTGTVKQYCVPVSGYYKLEAYGASGGTGYGNRNPVGQGGYTSAITHLVSGQMIYVYVGEEGQGQSGAVSYNGGGASGGETEHRGGQGGGATDFRLISGNWNNLESLKSRILVAGGGGGAQSTCGGINTSAGHGGGLVGLQSINSGSNYYGHIAYGGSQTSGGGYKYGVNAYRNGAVGGFGYGANAGTCASGAGSGYYGGGTVYTTGGGGGSSFVTGHEGCDTTYINYHKGIDGTQITFTDVILEQGTNKGYGKAKISLVSLD